MEEKKTVFWVEVTAKDYVTGRIRSGPFESRGVAESMALELAKRPDVQPAVRIIERAPGEE